MHQVSIIRKRCRGDGLCVRQCFRNCLKLDDEKKAVWMQNPDSPCVGCGHCTAVCPAGAVTLDGQTPEKLPSSDFHIPETELEKFLSSRRSVRIYRKKSIPRPLLQKVLHMACHAPTGANRREVGCIVIDSPDAIRELRLLLADWMKNYPRWREHFRRFQSGEDTIFRGAAALIALTGPSVNRNDPDDSALLAPQDAAGAASYLELALHGLGLASCWCGLLIRGAGNNADIRTFLRLPEGQSVYAALLAGYPAVHFPRTPLREISSVQWI